MGSLHEPRNLALSSEAPDPDNDAAAAAAAAKAGEQFIREVWTLLGVAVLVVVLRTIGRIRKVGWKELRADDYLVWLALTFYAVESALAYCVGAVARGMANNGMTDEERVALSPDDEEYHWRVRGSIIQLCGWTCYSIVLWLLKAALLFLYQRLTEGLARSYLIRIYVGFGLVAVSWTVVTLNLFLSCRPFHLMWRINPNPGAVCQPAVAPQIVWMYYAFNVVTDCYLLSIPIPLLWNTTIRPLKKAGLCVLFSGGAFIIVCATLRAVYIVTDPVNGAQLAGSWAVRETFVAVVTTNLPVVVPLLKTWAGPLLSPFSSSARSSRNKRDDTPRKDILTFGGGGGSSGPSWRRRGPPTANPITDNMTFGDSEEHMVTAADGSTGTAVPLRDVQSWDSGSSDNNRSKSRAIHKSVEVAVVRHSPSPERQGAPPAEQPWATTNHSANVEAGRGEKRG